MTKAQDSKTRGELFRFGPRTYARGEASFGFSCSRFGDFEERVQFGADGAVSDELLALLHVALGVSTYKAAAAKTVELPSLSPAGRAMAEALYTEGLAEFFVRSGLDYPAGTEFRGPIQDAAAAADVTASGTPLVAFGGGKDSYVAGRIVEEALGMPPQFASVVMAQPVADVLAKTAPAPPLLIWRSLDPKLMTLECAFSGHVPITAINILVLTIAGLLRGSGPILFANERSADEPTLNAGGIIANHQYSKSSQFEALVRAAVAEAAPAAPPTYSVLRPFSELWIASRFAEIEEAFPRFTSCNRNFRIAGDADKRWCGECAKCAFTSLVLSPFIGEEEAMTIFSRIMLDQDALLPVYEELCGLSQQKPWDCVGTIDECQAALFLLSRHPRWSETKAVRALMPRLLEGKSEAALEAQVAASMKPHPRGALPEMLFNAALRLPA
ncbi:hypothetical protein [Parvularcula lutaonensis]|uniref:UDP-N-acetyl-alpha-D-muramoyl-L-alanyl-L-glutamate epimerase n=1 Tax=Parvularcula lutaonensis TaxID=491923 RepID=A0ABV7MB25_9PROT|nr:hypothetical protein [Parvularcula lutaonensis]GGY38818.1 hypothetical protein GCM10007148_03930 [Parvularcula lutaonensis]